MDWGEFGKKIIGKKMIVLLLVTGAVYFFLQYLTPLLAPVLLAMLFVTIFGPMMKRMNQRLHFPRPLSAIVLLIVATVLLVGLLWILVSWMLGSLPVWIGNLELREQEWLEAVRGLCRSVGEIIGVDTAYLENTVSGRLQEGLDSLEENILPGMLSQSMQYVQWFAELGGFLVTFLIASVLLAKDYDGIMNRLLDQEACHVLLEVICGIVRYIATFVKAQGIIMTTIAMTAAATLGIAGINHTVACDGSDPGGDFRCAAFYRNGHRVGAAGSFSDFGRKLGKSHCLRCIVFGLYFPAGNHGASSYRQENRSVTHSRIGVTVCGNPAVRRLGDH